MKINKLLSILSFVVLSQNITMAQSTIPLKKFEKVIISPFIEATFVQGDKESIHIDDISVPKEKLNIDVSGNTLRVYLDGAKTFPKSKTKKSEDYKISHSLYDDTSARVTITYTHINDVSLRGEEKFEFKSDMLSEKFVLRIYGESKVYFNTVDFKTMKTIIYGESYVEIRGGKIGKQKITTYGESEVNTMAAKSESIKITAYGESDLRVYASQNIKITSYGEARIKYKGAAQIDKGIVIGEAIIRDIN